MAAALITAYAVANALGPCTEAVADALLDGRSGVTLEHPSFDAPVGALPFEPESLTGALAAHDTRQGRLAAHVAALVGDAMAATRRRWGAHRVGIVVGSSMGGVGATEEAYREHRMGAAMTTGWSLEHAHAVHATIEVLQYVTGARGPALAVAMGCSSSAKAIGSGQRLIESGIVDAVLVGGVDTLSRLVLQGFEGLGLSSAYACRPFSSERCGMNLGEGAALLLLERAGDAHVAVISVGEAMDVYDLDTPHPEGEGLRVAMQRALERGGIGPARVGHVHAHATATLRGDGAEARAITDTLGEQTPVVATKGYTGHLLGATGATEVVFATLALERGWLPASLGCEPLDARLGLRVVRERMQVESDYAMTTSYDLGGSSVAVLLEAREP